MPTLDVIIDQPVLFVESKCIEYLRATDTAFSDQFLKHAQGRLSAASVKVFESVFDDRYCFDPVDAPQLLKHFLAGKRVALEQGRQVLLLHVWWQPSNPEIDPVFAAHATASAALASALVEPDVALLAQLCGAVVLLGKSFPTLALGITWRIYGGATTSRSRLRPQPMRVIDDPQANGEPVSPHGRELSYQAG